MKSGDHEPLEASLVTRPRSDGLVMLPQGFGEWVCSRLDLRDENTLVARFTTARGDVIEVTVLPKSTLGPSFRRLSHCVVRYSGNLHAPTEQRKAEAGALVLGIGNVVNARLAALPEGTSIAHALGRSRESGRMVFSRESLRALLAPDILDGIPVADGWALADVYPTSYVREKTGPVLELVLDFLRERDDRRLLFVVAQREAGRAGFAQTSHFTLSHLSLGAQEPEGAGNLRALVSFVLQLRDHDGLEVVFPNVSADLLHAQLEAPGEQKPSEAGDTSLNLAINAECAQACAFCSIKQTAPAEDGGDPALQRYLADLAANREKGVKRLRLNGYDPLAYSRVLDVVRYAARTGYDHVDVFSPCTRLADAVFLDKLLEALPESFAFNIPLYGMDPAVHDSVVGRRGAHALVMRAIEHLLARVDGSRVAIVSVMVKENLTQISEISRFARERNVAFSAHMPYPSFESRADRYFKSAPRQTDVVLAMVPLYDDGATAGWPLVGIAPCVILRALRVKNVRPQQWVVRQDESYGTLPGTEYREEQFTHGAGHRKDAAFVAASVPCPHIAKCTLGPSCGGDLLRSYIELYGADEFRPVALHELVSATQEAL